MCYWGISCSCWPMMVYSTLTPQDTAQPTVILRKVFFVGIPCSFLSFSLKPVEGLRVFSSSCFSKDRWLIWRGVLFRGIIRINELKCDNLWKEGSSHSSVTGQAWFRILVTHNLQPVVLDFSPLLRNMTITSANRHCKMHKMCKMWIC